LFVQAVSLFQKALKIGKDIEPENKALIYNALGFAYFAQEQLDLAIRQYKEALKYNPEYTVALNNLGNIYERKQLISQALEVYEESLKYEPNNSIAKRRAESLRKRLVPAK
jgi:tetratricopeptide (TPR) repeat protein